MRNYSDNWLQFSRRNSVAMLVSLAYGYEEYRRDFIEFNPGRFASPAHSHSRIRSLLKNQLDVCFFSSHFLPQNSVAVVLKTIIG